jgi:hypothetical protein
MPDLTKKKKSKYSKHDSLINYLNKKDSLKNALNEKFKNASWNKSTKKKKPKKPKY